MESGVNRYVASYGDIGSHDVYCNRLGKVRRVTLEQTVVEDDLPRSDVKAWVTLRIPVLGVFYT